MIGVPKTQENRLLPIGTEKNRQKQRQNGLKEQLRKQERRKIKEGEHTSIKRKYIHGNRRRKAKSRTRRTRKTKEIQKGKRITRN